jgi:hypothetical protein
MISLFDSCFTKNKRRGRKLIRPGAIDVALHPGSCAKLQRPVAKLTTEI